MRRAFTVVATAAVAVAGLASPSAAATTLPLCQPNDGYVPGVTCEVAVTATVECVNNTAVLDYAVASGAVGGASTVDIRWTNLPGADIVLEDQPLTVNNQAWPAGADAAVTLVFGTSVGGVPSPTRVNVTVPAACSASLVLSAPENTPRSGAGVAAASSAANRARSASGVLAATGSEALPLALGGGALILGGAALVLARRARQNGA